MALMQTEVPAQATAATVQDYVIGECSHGGTVREVALIPEAAVAADATNNRTYRVINKGQAGVGTTVVASHQTTTGGALVAFDEKVITLSVVANATTVVEGDVLVADEIVTGTGQAHGGYTIKVIYST